jgi:hypothetical protein
MSNAAVPLALRDRLITEFRRFLCQQINFIPFEHQADWWVTTDGYTLTDTVVDPATTSTPYITCRLPNGMVEARKLATRPAGRAKVVAELGAYKSGKSAGAGMWGAAFAAVPNALVYLVGNEYDMCAPEFDYLLEALCSERGLNQKYKSLQNRPKDGRLWLEMENGARFEARSWERSESLKGKEVDAYIYCEAYQLPGIECFTSVAQNLRVRQGYAVFPTTPDRPWVGVFHENGHGHEDFTDWVCKCGVQARENPYSFDQKAMDRDRHLLTREKFSIAYLGKLGEFVGRVYNYQRGDRLFTPRTHPRLWHIPEKGATKENCHIPSDWRIEIGADTGTYCAAVVVGVSPEGQAFVLDELANYSYVAGTLELDAETSIISWALAFQRMAALWKARPMAWADSNSQFKQEFLTHGIHLIPNRRGRELRTEVTRQYFQHNQIFLAPWLSILPYEAEGARWPDRTTSAGRYERLKVNDHALDCLEHVLSRHPRGQRPRPAPVFQPPAGSVQWLGSPLRKRRLHRAGDAHLGGG